MNFIAYKYNGAAEQLLSIIWRTFIASRFAQLYHCKRLPGVQMIVDHKRYDLFGKSLLQKAVLQPPFTFSFPVTDNACFVYMLEGGLQYELEAERIAVPSKHSLFLNCINSSKQVSHINDSGKVEVIIINFHPDILKRVFDRELPQLLQPPKAMVSNQSIAFLNNDFLIQKYVEGLLFYFENPSLLHEDILILKLKEIMLLLSQTSNAGSIQMILSQLFSPAAYSFREIIEANLYLPLSMEELAQRNNLSLSSFKREFARLYNDSPASYIKARRLDKAAELLSRSTERITDIAMACGFNDLANFTKSFHDKYQLSPSDYRQRQTAK